MSILVIDDVGKLKQSHLDLLNYHVLISYSTLRLLRHLGS